MGNLDDELDTNVGWVKQAAVSVRRRLQGKLPRIREPALQLNRLRRPTIDSRKLDAPYNDQ
jgi:hypothetical protein